MDNQASNQNPRLIPQELIEKVLAEIDEKERNPNPREHENLAEMAAQIDTEEIFSDANTLTDTFSMNIEEMSEKMNEKRFRALISKLANLPRRLIAKRRYKNVIKRTLFFAKTNEKVLNGKVKVPLNSKERNFVVKNWQTHEGTIDNIQGSTVSRIKDDEGFIKIITINESGEQEELVLVYPKSRLGEKGVEKLCKFRQRITS